jgi:ketosteroid isomerase-like protein
MTDVERDAFLTTQRTCRVATSSAAGPHITPLWFAWDGEALWLNSIVGSQRWTDLERDPRIAVVIDAGENYAELRGVELRGRVDPVGEIPRVGLPVAELDEPERSFAAKYVGSDRMHHDGRHGWLKLVPAKVASWDFRKQFPPTVPSTLRAVAESYLAAVSRGLAEDVAAAFEADAVLLAPDGREIHGRGEIRSFYEEYLSRHAPQVRLASWFENGDDAVFEIAVRVGGSDAEFVGAVDRLTVGIDGLVRRLAVYSRTSPDTV